MHYLSKIIVIILLVAAVCNVQGRCSRGGCNKGTQETKFAAKRSDSDSAISSSSSISEDPWDEVWWMTSLFVDQSSEITNFDRSAEFTSISTSFVVPRIPTNIDNLTIMEFDLAMYTESALETFDFVGVGLSPDVASQSWMVYVFFCPGAMCGSSDFVVVPEGDKVIFSLVSQDGVWTGTAMSSSGVNVTYSQPMSDFVNGPMKVAGIQHIITNAPDCTWLSPSNMLNFTDLVILDRDVRVTDPKFVIEYTPNPCNIQSHTNGVSGWMTWISDPNTPGNSYDTCALDILQMPVNQWTQNGEVYYQFDVELSNSDSTYSVDVTSLSFRLSDPAYQLWILGANGDGSYSVPSYALPLAPSTPFNFGYIATKMLYPVNIQCIGGQRALTRDVTSTPVSEGDSSVGCSVRIDQEILGNWDDATSANVQVNVVVTNTGYRSVISLGISAGASASAISRHWSVSSMDNGDFGLPSWVSSLAVGRSFSFGYIAKSVQPIPLQITQALCY